MRDALARLMRMRPPGAYARHVSGRTVLVAAGGLAIGLLAISRVSSSIDLGFDADRVGSAGEWFAGIAGAAVLAWTIGEPARKERERRGVAAARLARQEAWEQLYNELAPFGQPYRLASQIRDWANDEPDADPMAPDRKRPSPYQLVRSRVEIPMRLASQLPGAVTAMERLANDLEIDRLLPCVAGLRRLHAWTSSQTWLPDDFAWLTANWDAIRDGQCGLTLEAEQVIDELRGLADRHRKEPTDADVDLEVRLPMSKQAVAISTLFTRLSDALKRVGA